MPLLRVLGASFALAVSVGATIGAGILRTPGEVALHLPHAGLFLLAWILGGVNALLGSTIFSELGTMMPRSGGQYVFVRRGLGRLPGFLSGYADWVNQCASLAAIALLVGEYLPVLLPATAGRGTLVAVAVLGALAAIQWKGVRSAGAAQQVTTALKALALVTLAVLALVVLPAPAPAAEFRATAPALVLGFAVAMQGVIFTYDAYYWMVYYGEEIENPGRAIPRAMFQGVAAIIGIYLLLNVAVLRGIPMAELAGEPFAGGALAARLFGTTGDAVIRAIMIVSLVGALNAFMMSAPRVLLAMATDGLFSGRALAVNRGGTPTAGLLLSLLVTGLFLLSGTFTRVLAAIAVIIVVNYVLVYVAFFVLRRREPDAPRPYRAWGYPWVQGVALAIAVAFLGGVAIGDPRGTLMAAAALAVGVVAYAVTTRSGRQSTSS